MAFFTKNKKQKIIFIILVIALAVCTLLSVFCGIFNTKTSSSSYVRFRDTKLKAAEADTSWQLWMFMYDSSVDAGHTPLQTINWAATTNETRVITLQINFRNSDVKTAYEPGQLQITVDNLGILQPTDQSANSSVEATTISADEMSSTDKKQPWSYSYDKSTNKYTFVNNNPIEEHFNFEGTIQLAYSFQAQYLLNDSNVQITSSLKDSKQNISVSSSNSLNFSFTSTEKKGTIQKEPIVMTSYDGLGNNASDYIWVKYKANVSNQDENNVRGIVYDYYLSETILDDCILLDGDQKKVERSQDNTYKIPFSTENSYFLTYPRIFLRIYILLHRISKRKIWWKNY